MTDQLSYLSVRRVDRPYWSDDNVASKGEWHGTYRSEHGMVRVGACKPWTHDQTGKDMPGYLWYEIAIHGLEIYLHEPFYRTPRGAAIIAGRLLRSAAEFKRDGLTADQYHWRMLAKWQKVYGIKMEA